LRPTNRLRREKQRCDARSVGDTHSYSIQPLRGCDQQIACGVKNDVAMRDPWAVPTAIQFNRCAVATNKSPVG